MNLELVGCDDREAALLNYCCYTYNMYNGVPR